jgi:hypothetical protein
VGDWIALETVGAALQDDELRRELLEVRGDQRPYACERRIVGARRQRHIELHALGGTASGF